MPNAIINSFAAYERATTNATPAVVLHNVSATLGGDDLWGHWSVRITARKVGTVVTRHWTQDVSGIWTAGAGLVLPATQPTARVEGNDPAINTASVTIVSGFDDMSIQLTGIAATNLNWYVVVETKNTYTEA